MDEFESIRRIIIICFISAAVGNNEQDEPTFWQWRAYIRDCISETGVDMDTLLEIKSGEQVETDDKVKCYAACMFKKLGIMKDDDTLDEHVIRFKILRGLPHGKINQFVNTCKTQVGKNSCETGGMLFKCVLDNQHF